MDTLLDEREHNIPPYGRKLDSAKSPDKKVDTDTSSSKIPESEHSPAE